MDKEAIKNELVREGELIISSTRNPVKSSTGISKLKALANHLGTIEDFTKKINDKLNEILKQQNITEFASEEEKSALIQYLKPAITELIRKYTLG